MPLLLLAVLLYLLSAGMFAAGTFTGANFRNIPSVALLLGFFSYALYFIHRYVSTGHFPIGDIYGMVSLIGNLLVLLFSFMTLCFRRNVIDFGMIVAFIGFLTTLIGIPAREVGYKNPFYVYHILSAAVAYASLILGGLASFIKLVVEKKLRTKHLEGFMVPVNLLRKIERGFLNVGFLFLTFTLIFGSLWAKSFLGKHWINDPKLILTLVLWVYYAFLTHLNLVKGIRPSRLSFLSFLGFLMVVASLTLIRHTVQ